MRLQTKLILSFGLVAGITLAVAATGYWQAQKLATALYEVGAVRLPSIQGLDTINEGMTAIRAAEHALLAPDSDEATLVELMDQERRAWKRVEKGWRLYEPLPQTAEEAAKWRAFVPAWRAWQAEHNAVMSLALAHRLRPDAALLARTREQSRTADRLAREAAGLLAELTALNDAVASAAKKSSVASRQDMADVKLIMFGTAALGVAGAVGLGIFLGRRISRPMEKMSEGFAAVARGDLNVQVPDRSSDEIGQAARAMNRMVEALRNAEATLRVISDNLPNSMIYQVTYDPAGAKRFHYVSAGVESLHGISVAAALRDPQLLYQQVVPEDQAVFGAAEQAALQSLTLFNVVVRVRRSDGAVRWRHLCAQPRRLPDGRIQCDGIELDITDRKQAEEALRSSEELLRSAMHHSPIGMALVAPEGGWLKVNPALCAIVGYTLEDMLATNWQALTHPDDLVHELPFLQRLLAGEVEGGEYEKRFLHRDGRVVWLQLNVSTVRDARGKIRYLVSQYQDITARKLAEESLKATADQLNLALQASRLGVWHFQIQTGAVVWDDRLFEIFGLSRRGPGPTQDEIFAMLEPEDRPKLAAARERLAANAIGYDLQLRIRRPDGELRHVSTQAIVLRDTASRPVAALGVVADLTDLVRATEESGRLREKLRQSQKMETLGTLAAGIAHDFNNLLTGINGFVELGVATLPPNHEAVEMLRQARHGATSARDLVRRILDFSRRVPDAERTAVSLATFVRNAAPLITAGLPDQVSLSFAMNDDAPLVKADASQMQQVLMNLCVNGAHAIGDRSGTLLIGLQAHVIAPAAPGEAVTVAKPGRYARLSVTDTGCGMTPEICARIFEPFYTTKKAGEGTGLGLSVVQDIVTDHGGFIRVQSGIGRGTTFEILLPASDGPARTNGSMPPGAILRGRGQRILVVDDEPAITGVARRALSVAGCRADIFNSAAEAWDHFAAAPDRFDLLLVDHQMPELSGLEFAGRARQVAANLPIVIMTGQVDDLDPGALQQLGRIDVLTKPFVIEELLGRVAASLQPQPAPASASASS